MVTEKRREYSGKWGKVLGIMVYVFYMCVCRDRIAREREIGNMFWIQRTCTKSRRSLRLLAMT